MKAPLIWLNDLVRIDTDPAELAEMLTMAGLEVGKVEEGEWGPVFDVDITSNRGDCLSMLGLAREISALLDRKLSSRGKTVPAGSDSGWARVRVEDPLLCPRYAARVIEGIGPGPSPEWMQERLMAAGMRPISNVVDATNYVMMQMGQPLHAFDYEELNENRIVVRRAERDEAIMTIDGLERRLDEQMLVIADAVQPVAIAGVMGGQESEVSDKTEIILLEAALFAPGSVRRTSKRLGLSTEASYRFERGVDPAGVMPALDMVTELILDMAPGAVVRETADVSAEPLVPRTVVLEPERVNSLLGTVIPVEEMVSLLRRLHFQVREGNCLEVTVPSWRLDVSIQADLVEEIARLHGYNNFDDTLPGGLTRPGSRDRRQEMEDLVRRSLAGSGLNEAVCFSLVDREFPDRLRLGESDARRRLLEVDNPLSEDHSVMRTTLLDGLLSATARNMSFREKDIALFEVGRVFLSRQDNELPEEKTMIGLTLSGSLWTNSWNMPAEAVKADFYLLKGIIEELLEACGAGTAEFSAAEELFLHPGRSARLKLEGVDLGYAGEVHPRVAAAYGIDGPVYAAELDFDLLVGNGSLERVFRQVPRFPAVERDIALLVPDGVSAARVVEVIKEAAGELAEKVSFFDLYRSDRLPEGTRSLAYSIVYRSPERTLTDEEVNAAQERVKSSLAERLSAVLR